MHFFYGLIGVLFLVGCQPSDPLKAEAKLPKHINECSGMTTLEGKTLWVIEDGGNKDKLYGLDLKGRVQREFKVSNAKNKDWEALTKDSLGNL